MDEPMQPPEQPGQQVVNAQMQPMQHPQEPQDVVDLELSGSSMRFLRASGSDIPIEFPADSKDEVSNDRSPAEAEGNQQNVC
jgi:hypothetical protein